MARPCARPKSRCTSGSSSRPSIAPAQRSAWRGTSTRRSRAAWAIGSGPAMANLFYRDVRQIFSVVIQLWMFVSAVVVPVPDDGSTLAKIIALNPLVPIINAYRDCILYGRIPNVGGFFYAAIMAAIFLVVGWVCFRRASFKFAECI